MVKEDYAWEKVYPELAGGAATSGKTVSPQGMLSKKLDAMLQEAKLDKDLISSLSKSIKDFESSAKTGAESAQSMVKINKDFANNANALTKQMATLTSNLESLNSVYGGILNAMTRK